VPCFNEEWEMSMSEGLRSTIRNAAQQGLLALVVACAPAAVAAQAESNQPLYMQHIDGFRNKTLEQKIQELQDREEIRELISTYAHRVAHGESIADLFTEDGVWTMRTSPNGKIEEVSGMKELKAKLGARHDLPEHPMPMIHNYLISIHGDEATGINSNELRITNDGKSIIASGYYEDTYRRENGWWKFVRRDTTFFHWVPIQQGWAEPVEK